MIDITFPPTQPECPQTDSIRNATSFNMSVQPRRNPNLAKWNILFDKKSTEWISFKPKLGLQVYPCYACRNIFGSKNSFLDHVNRRGMLLKYKCSYCTEQDMLTFYNPCSFLLHARQHYSLLAGQINLEHMEVSVIPFGLAGFLPDPNIPILYDVEDDNVGETTGINTRFYSPVNECMGNPIVNLIPNELLFYYADESTREVTSLTLKQVSQNIPRCKFIPVDNNRFGLVTNSLDINSSLLQPGESCIVRVKQESQDSHVNRPIVSSVESVVQEPTPVPRTLALKFKKCPECNQAQNVTMSEHFLQTNHPFLQSLRCNVCKYIAPTKCSLRAHERIHESLSPYVCPECGRDFPHWKELHEHMNEVCFHLTKQVRIKCSSRRCGKIFAQMATFSSHFLLHMTILFRCMICDVICEDELAFVEHNLTHQMKPMPGKMFKCNVCINVDEIFSQDTVQDHIRQHATSKFLYVYICKRCHSYFRSPPTYATHLLRCARLISPQVNPNLITHQQSAEPLKIYTCSTCKTEFYEKLPSCPKCSACFSNSDSLSDTMKVSCPLCTEEYSLSTIVEHIQKLCRYSYPIVGLVDCNLVKHEVFSPKSSDSNISKRKGVESVSGIYKNRKVSTSGSEPDLSIDLDETEVLKPTYICKLCNYSSDVRDNFQRHIRIHRDVATFYQCLECGECFVAKPSLSIHLLFYHRINDLEKYFQENNCFDKQTVPEWQETNGLTSGKTKQLLEKNQCNVCLLKFNEVCDLQRHACIHGRLFLMKNSK